MQTLTYVSFYSLQTHSAYEWFIKENCGLQTCLLSLRRHRKIAENIVSVLIQMSRGQLADLFTVQMRRLVSSQREYLANISTMIYPLAESKLSKDEVFIAFSFI